ncbi:hypothetical protein, partial [Ferirhizobium litorale]|uniref:hypothetical protein n=1 Tax=Ferirhizobium litorale TaxID=2927786 RepID=UPI0035304E8B
MRFAPERLAARFLSEGLAALGPLGAALARKTLRTRTFIALASRLAIFPGTVATGTLGAFGARLAVATRLVAEWPVTGRSLGTALAGKALRTRALITLASRLAIFPGTVATGTLG